MYVPLLDSRYSSTRSVPVACSTCLADGLAFTSFCYWSTIDHGTSHYKRQLTDMSQPRNSSGRPSTLGEIFAFRARTTILSFLFLPSPPPSLLLALPFDFFVADMYLDLVQRRSR